MFRNVVASLNEALDITMHLKPLTSHFEVTDNVNQLYQWKMENIDLENSR